MKNLLQKMMIGLFLILCSGASWPDNVRGQVAVPACAGTKKSVKVLNKDGAGADGSIVGTGAQSLGHANGVTLVSAVAGKTIVPLYVVIDYVHATTAYTGGNINYISTKPGVAAIATSFAAAVLTGASANLRLVQTMSSNGQAMGVGTDLIFWSTGAYTQPGTAAGTLTVTTYYYEL